ncbi:MAG: rhomboid family intramembrane serine protease [Gemmatimonadetes bacterium]|nr:rhomboid family intramembrane serine protease [Gemmatimonadota bacterium]
MVFPIGDDDSALRGRHHPVTLLLILANVAVFFLQLSQGEDIERFFLMWAVVPLEYAQGADLPPAIPLPFWSTLFSSMFMHGGWAHLGGNMLYLWIFGDNVEDAMGRVKYLLFYLLCGVIAAAAQILVDPASRIPSLGASGAISGVLAAYLVLYPKQQVRVFLLRGIVYMPALIVIGMWIVFQFVNGIGQLAQTEETGGVAYAAHIGGFLAGLVLVGFFRTRRAARAI